MIRKKTIFVVLILAIYFPAQGVSKKYSTEQDSVILSVEYNYDKSGIIDSLIINCNLSNNSTESIYINKEIYQDRIFLLELTEELHSLYFKSIHHYMWYNTIVSLNELQPSENIDFVIILLRKDPDYRFLDREFSLDIDFFLTSEDTMELFEKTKNENVYLTDQEWLHYLVRLQQLHRYNSVIIDIYNRNYPWDH